MIYTRRRRRRRFHTFLAMLALAVIVIALWSGRGLLERGGEVEGELQLNRPQPEQGREEPPPTNPPPQTQPSPEQAYAVPPEEEGSNTGANSPQTQTQPNTEQSPSAAPASSADPDDEWRLMLVSPSHPVGYYFTPPSLETIVDHHRVDSRIAGSLREMIAAAQADGITLIVTSAYRPAERQRVLHNQQIERFMAYGRSREEAIAVASTIVLPPGTSEHQTGLAVDIVTPEHHMLTEAFADTPAGIWLAANSYRFGFILRYPRDSMHITGVIFEPWHFRYVGREHARAIFEGGYILEEYLLALGR